MLRGVASCSISWVLGKVFRGFVGFFFVRYPHRHRAGRAFQDPGTWPLRYDLLHGGSGLERLRILYPIFEELPLLRLSLFGMSGGRPKEILGHPLVQLSLWAFFPLHSTRWRCALS